MRVNERTDERVAQYYSLYFWLFWPTVRDLRGGGVEGLEDDLDELLAVGLWVERSLGVEMRRLIGRDSQLVVEGVMPHLLHVIPGSDDTVLDRVLQGEDTCVKVKVVYR